jgi:dethiobiotin synthetase
VTAKTLVVTGTDTGVGKTRVACALLRRARARGLRVCGFKPVATGCDPTGAGLRNSDALALEDAAGSGEPYGLINPYAFEPPIAPHLAAAAAGRRIRTLHLDATHRDLASRHDLIVLEGAGGWRVPLDETWLFSEWVAEHDWPVLLVVGMRLGCINHALLTAESVVRRVQLTGWVANVLPPAMDGLAENIEALRQRLSAPCWGVLDAGATDFADAAEAESALTGMVGAAAHRAAGMRRNVLTS